MSGASLPMGFTRFESFRNRRSLLVGGCVLKLRSLRENSAWPVRSKLVFTSGAHHGHRTFVVFTSLPSHSGRRTPPTEEGERRQRKTPKLSHYTLARRHTCQNDSTRSSYVGRARAHTNVGMRAALRRLLPKIRGARMRSRRVSDVAHEETRDA